MACQVCVAGVSLPRERLTLSRRISTFVRMARQKFTDNERGVRRERAYQFGHLLVETRHVSTEWLLNRKLYHHEIFFQKELTLRLLFAGVLKAVVCL